MKIIRNIFFSIAFVTICLIVLWLRQYKFFLGISESDFNNLFIPIITLFNMLLLIWTLNESISFNKTQSSFNQIQTSYNRTQYSINEYNILIQDFDRIKLKLENLRFEFKENDYSKSLTDDLQKSNGINYCTLLDQFLAFEISKSSKGDNKISHFRNHVIYPILRTYRELEVLINDILSNELLSVEYKIRLYKKMEQLLLQDYFRICNNSDNKYFAYNLDVFTFEGVFKGDDFKRINKLFIENELFYLYPEKEKFYIENT